MNEFQAACLLIIAMFFVQYVCFSIRIGDLEELLRCACIYKQNSQQEEDEDYADRC